jgi:SAM-dependent methyltransferase
MKGKVAGVLAQWLDGVTETDFEQVAETHLSPGHVEEAIRGIGRYLPGYLTSDRKILEVGSGFGAFAVFGRGIHGLDITGAEPDPVVRAYAQEFAERAGVECTVADCAGEDLSFPDRSFDLVFSSNVLEHVKDPARVLAEAIRVLKPGGYLFFTYPNYCSFWEGHYGMFWIPCMPKSLAKLYVSLFGRNTGYIDSLQFVNVGFTRRIIRPLLGQARLVSLGDDLWQERMRTLKFGEWGQTSRLKRVLASIHKIPFLLEAGIFLGKLMHWYYPIVLVMRKEVE